MPLSHSFLYHSTKTLHKTNTGNHFRILSLPDITNIGCLIAALEFLLKRPVGVVDPRPAFKDPRPPTF